MYKVLVTTIYIGCGSGAAVHTSTIEFDSHALATAAVRIINENHCDNNYSQKALALFQ
jgi:hypothetical protein